MSLLPFLLVTLGGAVAMLVLRRADRIRGAVGTFVLLAAIVSAVAITPGEAVRFGGSGWVTTAYLETFLVVSTLVAGLLAFTGAAGEAPRDGTAVAAIVLGTSALALAVPDPSLGVLVVTIGGIAGALLVAGRGEGRVGATTGVRVLRATIVAGAMAIAAAAWIGRDLSQLAAQPVVFGLAYLAMALAVAIRFGAIPFHPWSARLADAIPEVSLPLVTAIAPAALAVVALAWTDASIAPLLVDTDQARVLILAVAVASILFGALAAWIQDDLEHIVGYSIIGDAGVLLLAVAALDPAAWAPARIWILAFIAARSAFAAWAAATRRTFSTGRVDDLHGWAVRSPALGIALVLVVVATISFPGLAAFDARASLVELALDGPLATIVLLGTLAPIAYYARLLVVGLARPEGVSLRRRWRPDIAPLDLTDAFGWAQRTWAAERTLAATAGAIALAIVALGVSVGAFGGPAAAAGLPPMLESVTESFTPEGPTGPGVEGSPGPASGPGIEGPGQDAPSGAPSPSASLAP